MTSKFYFRKIFLGDLVNKCYCFERIAIIIAIFLEQKAGDHFFKIIKIFLIRLCPLVHVLVHLIRYLY